jgi:hypothetical protein
MNIASHQGKECHVRERIRRIVASARRQDRRKLAGLDERTDAPSKLAAEAVRLAKLAAEIHLAEIARLSQGADSRGAEARS